MRIWSSRMRRWLSDLMELMRLGHLLAYFLIGAVLLLAAVFLNIRHTQDFRQDTLVFLSHERPHDQD